MFLLAINLSIHTIKSTFHSSLMSYNIIFLLQRKFTIQLKAKAWTNNMYVCLPDEPPPLSNELNSEESMAASPPLPGKKHPAPVSLVLLFTHHLSSVGSGDSLRVSSANEGGLKKGGNKGKANTITISEVSDIKVERELAVGCIKSSLVKKVKLYSTYNDCTALSISLFLCLCTCTCFNFLLCFKLLHS